MQKVVVRDLPAKVKDNRNILVISENQAIEIKGHVSQAEKNVDSEDQLEKVSQEEEAIIYDTI